MESAMVFALIIVLSSISVDCTKFQYIINDTAYFSDDVTILENMTIQIEVPEWKQESDVNHELLENASVLQTNELGTNKWYVYDGIVSGSMTPLQSEEGDKYYFSFTCEKIGLVYTFENSTIENEFKNAALEIHNEYRSMHGAKNLHLNADLTRKAQYWANILASRDRMDHYPPSGIGENLAGVSSKEVLGIGKNAAEKIRSWYTKEIGNYNFGITAGTVGKKSDGTQASGLALNEFSKTAHATAMVWKAITELGIAAAYGSYVGVVFDRYDNLKPVKFYTLRIVGRYKTAGNIWTHSQLNDNVAAKK